MLITLINKLFVGRWVIYIVDVDGQFRADESTPRTNLMLIRLLYLNTSVLKIPCGAHVSSSCMFVVCRGLIGWG